MEALQKEYDRRGVYVVCAQTATTESCLVELNPLREGEKNHHHHQNLKAKWALARIFLRKAMQ